jgi:hypothetical protein
MKTVGDIPPKERYLWIYEDSEAVVIFKNTEKEAARTLGWPLWKVKEWRRKNFFQKEKPAKQYDRFHSENREVETYVGERLLDRYHKYQRTNSTRKPFVDFT